MKFLKIFLAALLAVVVGSFLTTLLWVMTLVGMAGSMETPVVVEENSILKIDFTESISDSPSTDPFAGLDFTTMEMTPTLSLYKALQAIDAAKTDDRIKGLYIRPLGTGPVSTAALEELRAAIADFKAESGKFVVAYGEMYGQGQYYLATVADKIYLQKEGSLSWMGMSYTIPFFKGLFDKLGIEYEIFRPTVCKYKSAVEPYFLKKMSPENREQNRQMISTMWQVMNETVAESRGLSVEELNRLADNLQLALPEDVLKHGLVDGLIYEDEMNAYFAEQGMEKNDDEEYNFVTLGDYASQLMPDVKSLTAPQVAIVYAEGQIIDGEGTQSGTIFGNSLAEEIAKVRKNDDIKAVVLRVNSPGGSALASDVIWREIKLLQAEKPVVVSMGDYAASGGYYISAPADAILCNKLTLTGSIGVFGAFPCVGEMAEDKLGITFDNVKTNRSADFGQGFLLGTIRPSTPAEKAMLIRSVDKVYESFTTKVSEGRNLEMEQVLDIAGGRVWSGVDALKIGLADSHGGLKDAIAVAASKAGLEQFQVVESMPELEGLAAIFSSMNARIKAHYELDALGRALQPYKKAREILEQRGVLMYCPYEFSIL